MAKIPKKSPHRLVKRLENIANWGRKQGPLGVSLFIIMTSAIINTFLLITKLAVSHFLYPALGGDSWRFTERDTLRPLQWLIAQHNEHRIVFSKLATLIETDLLHLPPTSTALAQAEILLIISSFLIYLICRQSLKSNRLQTFATLACILILINPWQYENLYWEFQTPWLLTNMLVLVVTLVLINWDHRKGERAKLMLVIIATIIPWAAIYNIGQGIAVATSLCLGSLLKSRKLFLASLGSTATALIFYFVILPYEKPSIHPRLGFKIDYFSKLLLGSPWEGLAILMLIFTLYILIYPKRSSAIPQSNNIGIYIPGLFAIFFAAITTLSRSGFGVEQATSSRYVTHSLMLAISGVLIISRLIEENAPSAQSRRYNKNSELLPAFAVTATTIFSFPQVLYGSPPADMYGQAMIKAKEFQETSLREFRCKAQTVSLEKENIKPKFICKGILPTDPLVAANYFNGKLQLKPLRWHDQLLIDSKPNMKINKTKTFTYSIDHISKGSLTKAEKKVGEIDMDALTIKGWAFAKRQPTANTYIIAEYLDGKKQAFILTRERPDVAQAYGFQNVMVGFNAKVPTYNGSQPLQRLLFTSRYGSDVLPISPNIK